METLQLKKVGATPSTFFCCTDEKPMNFGFNWMKVKKGYGRITSNEPPRGTTEGQK